jgi:hypothetical protein
VIDFDNLDDYIDPDEGLIPGNVRERLTDPKFVEGLRTAPMIVAFMCQSGGNIVPIFGKAKYIAAGGPKNVRRALKKRRRIEEGNDPRNTSFPAGTFLMGCRNDTDDLPVLVAAVEQLRGRHDLLELEDSRRVGQHRPSDN